MTGTKYFKFHITLLVIGVAILVSAVLSNTALTRGQTPRNKPSTNPTESRVKPTSLARNNAEPVPTSESLAAAAQNASLVNDLNWTFGGKQQHGWYLYTPLIIRLLQTDAHPLSPRFATVLADWQAKEALKPTGILDEDSMYAMVSTWQGRRLKDRTEAQPEQLITAPISDFYDPTRLEVLRQVERETYAAYKRMIAAAVSDPTLGLAHDANGELADSEKYLKIISSFRSREYQEELRRKSPGAGRAGLAINSPHFTGRALDLYVGGKPVETEDSNRALQVQTRVYQWLVRNADRFGFVPYYYEPWHWEYVR
jgi:uncharacterized protein YcbK (DUF882 family)